MTAGRPRWWVAGLSLSLALVVGLGAWWLLDDDPYDAPPPTAPTRAIDDDGAASAVRQLLLALRHHDPDAAAALAPSGDDRAAEALRALVANSEAAQVGDLDLRYVDSDGGLDEQGRWRASVAVAWRYAGFDRSTAHSAVPFVFEDTGDGVAVVGVAGRGRVPVWMQGQVRVSRSPHTLVVAARGLGHYDALARTAVRVVRRVLPGWRSGLVVEVPATQRGLDRALDADGPREYADIAAVTSSVDGTFGAGSPVHVFVNPAVFGGLRAQGAQVVMSHEATHVATGAAGSPAPLWLVEGFADYVALRDVDLPLSTTAGQVIRQTRRRGAPASLPGAEEFDTSTTHLGATYEAAWLACRELARRSGQAALVRFYDAVDSGQDEATTFRRVFGLSEGAFTQRWRRSLVALAHSADSTP